MRAKKNTGAWGHDENGWPSAATDGNELGTIM